MGKWTWWMCCRGLLEAACPVTLCCSSNTALWASCDTLCHETRWKALREKPSGETEWSHGCKGNCWLWGATNHSDFDFMPVPFLSVNVTSLSSCACMAAEGRSGLVWCQSGCLPMDQGFLLFLQQSPSRGALQCNHSWYSSSYIWNTCTHRKCKVQESFFHVYGNCGACLTTVHKGIWPSSFNHQEHARGFQKKILACHLDWNIRFVLAVPLLTAPLSFTILYSFLFVMCLTPQTCPITMRVTPTCPAMISHLIQWWILIMKVCELLTFFCLCFSFVCFNFCIINVLTWSSDLII